MSKQLFNKKALAFLLTAVLLAAVSGCAAGDGGSAGVPSPAEGGAASGDTVILKLAHNASMGQPVYEACEQLAADVYERNGGRVEIQTYPNNVLGVEVDTRDMIVESSVDMVAMGSPSLGTYTPVIDLTLLLYAFDSEEQMMHVMAGDFGQKYFNDVFLEEKGVRVLSQWPQAAREVLTTKPFRQMEDLKSIKMRMAAGTPAWEDSWATTGVLSVSLALDELYTALDQGVCDGLEMPIDFMYNYRFQEKAKYLTLTNHKFYCQTLLINENAFQRLSDEDQQILLAAADDARALQTQLLHAGQQETLDNMVAEGVEVIAFADADAFKALIEPLYEQKMDSWGREAYDDFIAAKAEVR